MSIKSIRTIVNMAAGLLLLAAYLIFALGRRAPDPYNLSAWAVTLLIFIGIGVVLVIVIQILFHIFYAIGVAAKESMRHGESGDTEAERIVASSLADDEMDRIISLKSLRAGYVCGGLGGMAFLGALAIGLPAVSALHILLGSFFLGTLVEGGMSVFLYEWGVSNG
ncbi:hypothetical protein [Breznakiella homolactica]|uniref:Uncharacterized protein n=1 Tax=Breznakiella homolactica TaxID=2798577 RepID=A0A7T7XMM5_9SPIR|nr:hypothetical protein [Breznakiella homolactica]QQO09166.1 hypothetical protein JFL75_19910 [Breznakiella homolactica]